MKKKEEKKQDKLKNVKKEEKKQIKIIDKDGYDIEQFLCRCSNKTGLGMT